MASRGGERLARNTIRAGVMTSNYPKSPKQIHPSAITQAQSSERDHLSVISNRKAELMQEKW